MARPVVGPMCVYRRGALGCRGGAARQRLQPRAEHCKSGGRHITELLEPRTIFGCTADMSLASLRDASRSRPTAEPHIAYNRLAQASDQVTWEAMDWLFTDTSAATLTVIIGVSLLAVAWSRYGQ
jgi:hypothetical protein